jgi:hypothetical protein
LKLRRREEKKNEKKTTMMKKPIYFSHTCHPITKEML